MSIRLERRSPGGGSVVGIRAKRLLTRSVSLLGWLIRIIDDIYDRIGIVDTEMTMQI